MEKSEFLAYAGKKYQMAEQHKWSHFPSFSVLVHPESKKWVAVLTNTKEADGSLKDLGDLRCGQDSIRGLEASYLSKPVRMRGENWVGITFGPDTEAEVVFRLLDKAVEDAGPSGYKVVIEDRPLDEAAVWRDTPIPPPSGAPGSGQPGLAEPASGTPARITVLERMIKESRRRHPIVPGAFPSFKAADFCEQARFMEDYEDDFPWTTGYCFGYQLAYESLSPKQLRGYFSWRSRVRRGDYAEHVPAAVALIYVYELLNGIGASSPEDALAKLTQLEKEYLAIQHYPDDYRMLHAWMFDLCVLRNLPADAARLYDRQTRTERDAALAVLRDPAEKSDEEVFSALMQFSEKQRCSSRAFTKDLQRARSLFAAVWRRMRNAEIGGDTLFELCFGQMKTEIWYPMWNALYYMQPPGGDDFVYQLNACRSYRYVNGMWYVSAYNRDNFDLHLFRGLMHAVDLKVRRLLQTGGYLRPKEDEAWAEPYIDEVIREEEAAREAASRPVITIDMDSLAQIRKDAAATRESLLTDEEREAPPEAQTLAAGTEEEPAAAIVPAEETPAAGAKADSAVETALTDVQVSLLKALLEGRPAEDILRQAHLMPTIAADQINEALFDLVGDNVVDSDGDSLSLIEDYREEAEQALGGGSQ